MRDLLLVTRAPLAAGAVHNALLGVALGLAAGGVEGVGFNVLAGVEWATAGPALGLLALGTCAAYWAGMALNDLCDLERDRQLAPNRPLPSGRLSPNTVALLVQSLAVAAAGAWVGAGLLLGRGWLVGVLAMGALLLCVVGYDAWLKRYRLPGSLAMGSCRTVNVLGAAWIFCGGLPPTGVLIYALALGAYVAALTWLSTFEDEEASPLALNFGSLGLGLSGLGAAATALPWPGSAGAEGGLDPWRLGLALLALAWFAWAAWAAVEPSYREGTVKGGQARTRNLLKAIWWVDGVALLGGGAWFLFPLSVPLQQLGGWAARRLFRPPPPASAA